MTFGFVIVRHVNSETTNQYWQECYRSIRKFYDQPIMIVDDHSDPTHLTEGPELVNCQVIQSEYPKVGELLGYYYFYKLQPFNKAIILHDSIFFQQKIDFQVEQVETVKFLWHFHQYWDPVPEILSIISHFDQAEQLTQIFEDKTKWKGCFGLMSIIDWHFLTHLNHHYNFFPTVLAKIDSRGARCCMERIFAVACAAFAAEAAKDSFFGYIFDYYPLPEFLYEEYKNGCFVNYSIVKVWTGR